MQASEKWTVGCEAGADDGHGWFQLTPHVRRRQRVCNNHVSCLPAGTVWVWDLTWQISSFDQVDSNDAHQASHADQATQSKDARQHKLLACFKLQPPDHIQRHTQNDDIKCHVRGCNCAVIRLQIYAFVRESVLGIPHTSDRLALKYETEDCSYSPRNACCADDPCSLLEYLSVEDPAIH